MPLPLNAVLGFDFGTSCVKRVVRLPDEPDGPAFPVPVLEGSRAEGSLYLWRTGVERIGDRWVATNSEARRLKEPLLRAGPVAPELVAGATAFLASLIRHAMDWFATEHRDYVRDRKVVWSLHLGVPATGYDEPKVLRRYRRIGAAAQTLAVAGESLDVGTVISALEARRTRDAEDSKLGAEAVGLVVLPELLGATQGFSTSRVEEGLYQLVDIGAWTLDTCVFRVFRPPDSPDARYSIFAARIDEYGVRALEDRRRNGGEASEQELLDSAHRKLCGLVVRVKLGIDSAAPELGGFAAFRLFTIGGGRHAAPYRKLMDRTRHWLSPDGNQQGIRLTHVVDRDDLARLPGLEAEDAMRLVVATGLSFPPDEFGDILPPSEVEPVVNPESRNQVDYSDRYVGPEQT